MPERLRTHRVRVRDAELALRPMTEEDWPLLLAWNSDPEVLYFSEGDDVASRSLDEVQRIYRSVSRTALMCVIEVEGRPIGEGWLQRMNLPRVLERRPGLDLRRVDLTIGEKACWGRGYGTRAIRLMTRLALQQGADAVYAVDVADYNLRSRRAFERAGYQLDATIEVPSRPRRAACTTSSTGRATGPAWAPRDRAAGRSLREGQARGGAPRATPGEHARVHRAGRARDRRRAVPPRVRMAPVPPRGVPPPGPGPLPSPPQPERPGPVCPRRQAPAGPGRGRVPRCLRISHAPPPSE